jgi:hypothetical protein
MGIIEDGKEVCDQTPHQIWIFVYFRLNL